MVGWEEVHQALPNHVKDALIDVRHAERALGSANDAFRRALQDEIDALED